MKELAIGETVRIRCVADSTKNEGCEFCIFKDFSDCYDMKCSGDCRKDGKDVHYELVVED